MKIKFTKCYTESGYVALISVLVSGAIVLVIAVSLILLGLSSSRSSFALEQSNQARALANACAEDGLQEIKDSVVFVGTGNLTLGQGMCSYTVINNGGTNRKIISLGVVGTTIRKIQIIVDKFVPQINVVSWQEVSDF